VLVSSYISPKAAKGQPSAIQGRGLVAVAPIAKDEIVAIKGGHIVDSTTLAGLPERLRNSDVQIADGFHLVALEEAEYESVMLVPSHDRWPGLAAPGVAARIRAVLLLVSAVPVRPPVGTTSTFCAAPGKTLTDVFVFTAGRRSLPVVVHLIPGQGGNPP